MKVVRYPKKEDWSELLKRPEFNTENLEDVVKEVLSKVKQSGDEAIKEYTLKFDHVDLKDLVVTQEEIKSAEEQVPDDLKQAIKQAIKNITAFHEIQKRVPQKVETLPGVTCWRKTVPIEKVGLYIPGGSAPLFSTVLMLGIPAKLAGCKEIVLCSPPSSDGKLNPAILYSASLVGITQIYKVGGIQAIAAMAYGTKSIPQVYKVFGPGNQYVTCAKKLINKEGTAIDMPAGPSEVAVLADESSRAEFVAADLLSQAEHGPDSQVILFTTQEGLIEQVQKEIESQLNQLPRKSIAEKSLAKSKLFLLKDTEEAIAMSNAYAPEHLILSCKENEKVAEQIVNAGSVFLGNYSPESVGDYASGTNHTLPTNGFAKAYSGVSLDSFVKNITFQKLTKEGLKQLAHTVESMAAAEGLEAHKNAVAIRKA